MSTCDFKFPDGKIIQVQHGEPAPRSNFQNETVLISVPMSEDKLFCFPSLIIGIKALLASTKATCEVAFAVNSDDKGVIEAISNCGINHIIVPALRNPNETAERDNNYWMDRIITARKALREIALIYEFDYMFFLDSDTCIDPDGLNRLLSYNMDEVSAFCTLRHLDKKNQPIGMLACVKQGDPPWRWSIPYSDTKKLQSPIYGAYGGFGACLISRRAFSKLNIQKGVVPSQGVTGKKKRKRESWGEDTFFGYQAFMQGFITGVCHKVKTLHFIDPKMYPNGYTPDGEGLTYEKYMECVK